MKRNTNPIRPINSGLTLSLPYYEILAATIKIFL
jgi:hypothetical protein